MRRRLSVTPSLKLTQPELYFAELSHEPVFVDTAQQEFNYPSGSETEYTEYTGPGGFPSFVVCLCGSPPPFTTVMRTSS